jgi:hypothetical protein
MAQAAQQLAPGVRLAGVAAGASVEYVLRWALLPALRPPLAAAGAWAFCRLLPEATILQMVFAAVRAHSASHAAWASLGGSLLGAASSAAAADVPYVLAPPALLLALLTGLSAGFARRIERVAVSS